MTHSYQTLTRNLTHRVHWFESALGFIIWVEHWPPIGNFDILIVDSRSDGVPPRKAWKLAYERLLTTHFVNSLT
jgi:hypothetical protein